MSIDLSAVAGFLAGHARVLDRRRHELLTDGGAPDGVLAALDGYRNPDGGYGWGLESDLRSPESQPGGALHALEVFADIAPHTSGRAVELCDWLQSVSHPDGGLPFALPVGVTTATAPWWLGADAGESSLQITSIVAANALRVPNVVGHPWLERAVRYCLDEIARMEREPHAIVLAFAVRFLDELHASRPGEAADLLRRLGRFIPADGRVRVEGGTEEESMRPLDFAPYPDRPARDLFAPDVIAADLDRLAGLQQDDGGWVVDFARISPAGALDWRGHATLAALDILRRNGRI